MEYYLCRALEVARLDDSQLALLHKHEKSVESKRGYDYQTQTYESVNPRAPRALTPFEIQQMFNLPTLKEHYCIPSDENTLSVHMDLVRKQLRAKNLVPLSGELSSFEVEKVHNFDANIREEVTNGIVSFFYSTPLRSRKKSDFQVYE